jgi:FeoB-associated Cys-rich membrane protein
MIIVNSVIGTVIFGYAGYTLFNFVKNNKKGKCAGCSKNKSCQSKTCNLFIKQDMK